MEALRSSVWSSETLVQGIGHVSKQPVGFLAKTEEDIELVDEYHVLRLHYRFQFWEICNMS